MPLALIKGATFKISLDSDSDISEDKRPKFEFVHKTGRGQKALAKDLDGFHATMKNIETIDKIFELLEKHMVGWENMPVPYKKEIVPDFLQWQEAQELLFGSFSYSPRIDILKNLGLQLPTPSEKSAEQVNVEGVKTP